MNDFKKQCELTEKHDLSRCSMGRCCNASEVDFLENRLESMTEALWNTSIRLDKATEALEQAHEALQKIREMKN